MVMASHRLAVMSLYAVLFVACGASSSPAQGIYSVSGALMASGTCTASAAYEDAILGFNLDGGEALSFSAQLPGTTLSSGTYTPADVTFDDADYSDTATGNDWVSTNGGQGTFTLVVSSAGSSTVVSTGTLWSAPHGTLDATLPANAGTSASGTLTVHASF